MICIFSESKNIENFETIKENINLKNQIININNAKQNEIIELTERLKNEKSVNNENINEKNYYKLKYENLIEIINELKTNNNNNNI